MGMIFSSWKRCKDTGLARSLLTMVISPQCPVSRSSRPTSMFSLLHMPRANSLRDKVRAIRLPIRQPYGSQKWSDPLHVEVLHAVGVRLDEALAWRHLIAHQHRERLVGLERVVNRHLEDSARSGVHRGLPQLLRVHLAQPL